jgi:hypothetical protein
MKTLFFILCALLCFGCEDNNTQEADQQALLALFDKIETIAKSVPCEDAADWSFVAYGHKPCGGPHGYIAYSNQIDVEAFLRLIERYTTLEREFNLRWGIGSDCAIVAQPSGVSCENGEAILNY